jgi:hypothetical protein
MGLELLYDFYMLVFFMSLLNVIRHGYYLIQAWISSTEEQPIKYRMENKSLWILSFSLAYVITTIVNLIL